MDIYDCFMYFDEDLLLDLRMNALNKYVKKFIITEATYTHNGAKKKLNFNIKNFQKFKDKIEYIVVDKSPPNILELIDGESENKRGTKLILNGMARDYFQRENLNSGLSNAQNEDLVLISDLDEIPDLSSLDFSKINNNIIIFEQKMFYYKLNLLQENFIWHGSRISKKKHLIDPQWIRNIKSKKYPLWKLNILFSKTKYNNINFIKDGGWHFTNIKSAEEIDNKFKNYLHDLEYEESGLKVDDVRKIISEKKIIYDHSADKRNNKWNSQINLIKEADTHLPDYIVNNKAKFKSWID